MSNDTTDLKIETLLVILPGAWGDRVSGGTVWPGVSMLSLGDLLALPQSNSADMAHLCVHQNQALGICRGFVPDIQVCGTHGREDLVNAATTLNAEEKEEEEEDLQLLSQYGSTYKCLSR